MFCVGFQVQHETPEEGQRTYQSKHSEYNNEEDDNSLNILSDKDYPASSQKFRQIRARKVNIFFSFFLFGLE